jgi:plasmid stabilization system protein ParE
MKVGYAPRAAADLELVAEHSHKAFGTAVAGALETAIRATIARAAATPKSAGDL